LANDQYHAETKINTKQKAHLNFSFPGPVLKYADVVWNNLTKKEEHELEQIKYETALIITGATKLISLSDLHKETDLELLNLGGLSKN
jgi:hypothetical protein